MTAGHRRWRWFLAFAASVVGLSTVLELVLRLAIATPRHQHFGGPDGNYSDPDRRVVFSGEGYSVSHTSSLGLFDDEVSTTRPRLRALLLGDSFSEALQIDPAERFATVTEQLVPGLEIINTGMSGRGPGHYLLVLRHLDPAWDPDVVVLQLNDGDLSDVVSPQQPHVVSGTAGRFEVIPGNRGKLHKLIQETSRPLATRVSLANLALERVALLGERQIRRLRDKFLGTSEPPPPAEPRIDPVAARAIEWSVGAIARAAPRLIVLYLPELEYTARGCKPGRPDVRELYRRAAASAGAAFVDPGDAMCRDFARTGRPSHGFHNGTVGAGHLDARGHAIVARALAEAIE